MTVKKERMLLLVWLIINSAIGLWIVRDYGMSTDEPYYYLYAGDSLEAYRSFFGRLFEPEYGVTNLRYYGPAFIMLVDAVIRISHWLPGNIREVSIWHFSYFLTFQLTGLCLYGLVKRWFSQWTAWAVLVGFITQPLLWGHAFINPKDIPFMFFFVFSIWTGFFLVDSFAVEPVSIAVNNYLSALQNRWGSIEPPKKRIFWSFTLLILIGLTLSRRLVNYAIKRVIEFFYNSDPDSWAANLRHYFADDISKIPLEDYVTKAQTLYTRFDWVLFVFGFLIIGGYLLSLLSNMPLSVQIRSWWQRFPLKSAESRRHWMDHVHTQVNVQKALELIRQTTKALITPKVILAGVVLGLSTSVRVLGPLAGVIVVLFLFVQIRRKSIPIIIAYSIWAGVITYLSWPFLWRSPINNLYESLTVMSNFPWSGTALFNGKLYPAENLPATYLPVLLNLQFSETLIVLGYIGIGCFVWHLFRKGLRVDLLLYLGLGFILPILGVIVLRPPLYENFRQLLFLVPAMFLFGAFALDFFFTKIQQHWLRFLMLLIFIIPSLISLVKLHPYQYIYYNSFIGGVAGAFRRFEMDYWYTSLAELASWANEHAEEDAFLVARVGHRLIGYQVRPDLTVEKIGSSAFAIKNDYDYAILTTRWNTDEYYPDAEILAIVEREGGILAVLKDIKGKELEGSAFP